MASGFYEPFQSFEQFSERPFSGRQRSDNNQGQHTIGRNAVRPHKPRLNLHEDAEKNLVTASFEFPGLTKHDIQISVHNGRLTVVADTKETTEDGKDYAIRERRFGRFRRTLQLPLGVKEEQIKASMKDGILNITFPKTSPEHAPSRVAVS